MINDITGLSSSQTTSTRARSGDTPAAKTGGNGTPTQSPSSKGDTVKLSSAAVALQNVEKKLADTPDVDNERVAQLKQEIESGNYQINAERVAEKMLNFDNLL
ncbi:flagellar biosynthesis anti-sigma factor FlgM [Neptuniibacter halophilus]|uniref:flagellar biosynthesis anti-sigma factor FlgM n=1 Tax=Neptuniibacter halophilus TaxID=651666 RepID=UPI002573269D|nr:flagellar biosynthesis anti-sigma factor FlgM [Neptuniibacter halophilus]